MIYNNIAFFYGLLLVFNFPALNHRIILFFSIFLAIFFFFINYRRLPVAIVVCFFLISIFSTRVILAPYDNQTLVMLANLFFASISGLIIVSILETVPGNVAFARGLIIGGLLVTFLFLLQMLGLSQILRDAGIAPNLSTNIINFDGSITYVFGSYATDDGARIRFSGIWEHPNSAAHATLISIVGYIYMYKIRNNNFYIVLSSIVVLIVFTATFTRASIIVFILLLVSLILNSSRLYTRISLTFSFIVFVFLFILFGALDLLPDRLSFDASTYQNFWSRFLSMITGFGLVFHNPFGVAFDNIRLQVLLASGVGAVHNGYIFFSILFGLPLFGLFLCGGIMAVTKHKNSILPLLFLQLTLSSMFEELPHNSSFLYVFGMFIGCAVLRAVPFHIGSYPQELKKSRSSPG